MRRLIAISILIAGLFFLIKFTKYNYDSLESSTIALGLLLICAYLIGQFFNKFRLPKITGYIFTGLIFGPFCLKFIVNETLADLDFINHMALSLIAFYAGGELNLAHLKKYRKSFIIIIAFQLLIILGFTIILFLGRSFITIFQEKTNLQSIAIAILIGVVCIARSPSTAIAIISETKSQGRVTEMVIGITIALDVLVIVLFAIAISLCEALLIPAKPWDFNFFFVLIIEIVTSLILGIILGWLLSLYMKHVKAILPIILLTLGFLVTKFSYYLTDYLEHVHGIGLKIEPLLICISAGFFIQNFSYHGSQFMHSLDKLTLSIYTLFFSISGASLNLDALRYSWNIALVIFFIRFVMIALTTTTGAALARDPTPQRYLYWLGFIAQAGVTLGFAYEIVRRFPSWGPDLATIIIAVVSINQIVGPITFKYSLERAKETKVNIKKR